MSTFVYSKLAAILCVATLFSASVISSSVQAEDAEEQKEDARHLFNYDDLFAMEYAANPVVMPDQKHVLYERRSMDIMTDSVRRNLWFTSLDGESHLPLLSGEDNHFSPVFSRDGEKLAYLSSKESGVQIFVRDMSTGNTAKVTAVEFTPTNMQFSPDGKQLAFSMFTPNKADKLFSIPAKKPEGATWAEDAHYIDSTLFQRDGAGMNKPGNMHVYVVPAIGGTPRQITSGAHDFASAIAWGDDAKTLFISANTHDDFDFDVFNSDVLSIDIKSGEMTAITDMTGPENNPVMSPKGDKIAFTGFVDNGKSSQNSELYIMNVDGTKVESLTAELDRSVDDVQWADNGKGLYFSYDDQGKKHVAYVSLSGNRDIMTDALGGMSIGRPYTSGDFDVTEGGDIVYTYSNGVRPADLATGSGNDEVVMLTDLNGDVFDHKTINPPELMVVDSSVDDRELQAWIVKPPEFDASKKYPLLLEIHGGPHTAYGPEFSSEVQMFAAAGYVVIYGNPRGSTSLGSEFANLIDKNYPSQDYDDLMDMVDGVIEEGYVDTENMFVTGGSGGGVLTAWIIGKTDRFKAAVVAKPVINWVSMIGTSDIYTFMTKYWFTDLPWNDVDQYWDRSPLSLVGNVKTPTMVLTGELDVRTPMAESEQYYGALRLEGVESSLVRIQGAYHGIAAKPSNLARKIGYIIAWFDKYKDAEEKEGEEAEE